DELADGAGQRFVEVGLGGRCHGLHVVHRGLPHYGDRPAAGLSYTDVTATARDTPDGQEFRNTACSSPQRRRMHRFAAPNAASTAIPMINITIMIATTLGMSVWSW